MERIDLLSFNISSIVIELVMQLSVVVVSKEHDVQDASRPHGWWLINSLRIRVREAPASWNFLYTVIVVIPTVIRARDLQPAVCGWS